MIEAVIEVGAEPADIKFMKRWLSNRSFYSLENRLRHLARVVGGGEAWTVSATDMARLRNALAHGSNAPSPRVLRDAYAQAFALSRRIILRELGVDLPDER